MKDEKVAIRLSDGTRFVAVDSDEEMDDLPGQDQLVDEVLESVGRPLPDHLRGGRPSLHGGSGASPLVAFRLPPEVRRRAEAEASRRGVSLSQLAREALEHELA